jgi:metacaspase-1
MATYRALLLAINNYPPRKYCNLQGCLNDQNDMEAKLLKLHSDFIITKLSDSGVTISNVKKALTKIIIDSQPGDILIIHYSGHGTRAPHIENGQYVDGQYDEALFLYDGCLIHTDIREILSQLKDNVKCLVLLDACFSGSATRISINGKTVFPGRFIVHELHESLHIRRSEMFKYSDMKWMAIGGCGDDQTSDDALIEGKHNGAFTYYALKTLKSNYTIEKWYREIRKYLPSKEYTQHPKIEGNADLFHVKIFE